MTDVLDIMNQRAFDTIIDMDEFKAVDWWEPAPSVLQPIDKVQATTEHLISLVDVQVRSYCTMYDYQSAVKVYNNRWDEPALLVDISTVEALQAAATCISSILRSKPFPVTLRVEYVTSSICTVELWYLCHRPAYWCSPFTHSVRGSLFT